ncbi:MAG: multicopper oxidase domain-containing protein [Candidatus Eremiobacteraeota bacterium]|nr:multicopper oxidase domain-containing protein [Candidatus Eremiobacteraeota bacterium]MBV8223279.1 multicopper oxidase domain-containing protein [Candidatus Eremiobacteraeota bacterium]MBV8281426.1 multicopper oxidase domain-containing protein [Candidatus Eremiobacteraeota bacterium]
MQQSIRRLAAASIAVAAVALSGAAFAVQARADALEHALPGPVAADVTPAAVAKAEADAQRDYALLPSLPPLSSGPIATLHLVAEVKKWTPAPGTTVDAWTYNGTVPGPTIHVRQGDTLRVIFTNHLPAPTTIHWHGMDVPAAMDGTPGFSQPPVPPGQSFVYQFVVRQPGTYIYHTHVDDLNQLDRGLYGAVVVEPATPAGPPPDRDYLMLISSWKIYSSTENYFSINGKSYPSGKPFEVVRGQRIRVREIDISGTEFHTMHTHGHHFQVVAYDGQPVAPAQRQMMDTITLGPGETRDIEFVADAQPGTWMFHCHVADHMMNDDHGPGGLISAIHYAGTPDRFASMAAMDMMAAAGESAPTGPKMSQGATLVLGAIAGLTIFLGLPFAAMRGVSRRWIAFANAIAIGVLFFLLFDILRQAGEPVVDALGKMQQGLGAAPFAWLTFVYVAGLFAGLVGLVYFSRFVLARQRAAVAEGGMLSPMALATTIALGIGLHNFSEGLAIGQSAATGAIGLAVLLIIGFGLHNMTEGFGIAAPLVGSDAHVGWREILMLGLIGGGPTFLGTVIGYRFVSPTLSVLFLTLAAGAIIYVIGEMTKAGGRVGHKELATVGVFLGFILGLGTDLILTAAGA